MEPEFGAVAPASQLREALSNLVPAPVATLDFAGGSYVVNGVHYSAASLFASDSNYSDFDAADIVAAEGYKGPSGAGGGKFAGALLSLMQGLTSYVVMHEIVLPSTGNPTYEFDIYDDPDFSTEYYLNAAANGCEVRQPALSEQNQISFGASIASDSYSAAKLYINRLAMLVTPDVVAAAVIAKGVGVMPRSQDVPPDTWTFVCAENVRLRRLAIFSDVADISTLQMIAARGID